jgi:hypothetical protein
VSLLSDVPITSSRPQFQQDQVVDLSPQLGVPPTAYRNVSAGNCYSHSTDTLVCYGHHGRTTLFAQSPSDDESPPPLRQDQNTFRDCRSIEWHGRPSVTWTMRSEDEWTETVRTTKYSTTVPKIQLKITNLPPRISLNRNRPDYIIWRLKKDFIGIEW